MNHMLISKPTFEKSTADKNNKGDIDRMTSVNFQPLTKPEIRLFLSLICIPNVELLTNDESSTKRCHKLCGRAQFITDAIMNFVDIIC